MVYLDIFPGQVSFRSYVTQHFRLRYFAVIVIASIKINRKGGFHRSLLAMERESKTRTMILSYTNVPTT